VPRLAAAIVPLLLAALPTAAEPTLEPGPVGYWEVRNTEGILMLLISVDGSGDLNRKAFHWTYANGMLALDRQEKGPISYDASFTADTLTLSGGNLRHPVTFERVPHGTKPDERVFGAWTGEGGGTVELRPDGTGRNGREEFRFTALDGVLAYGGPSIAFSGDFTFEGDHLELTTLAGAVTLRRAGSAKPAAVAARKGGVVVNGRRIDARKLEALLRDAKVRILDGSYWYDGKCGAWGLAGGPALGYVPAGLDVLGPLDAKAPSTRTGVFVNGRELHPKDVEELRKAIDFPAGRYWMDAKGNLGFEGNETPFLALAGRMREVQFSAGGRYTDPSSITGVGRGEGRASFVLGAFPRILLGG
jgi:hypothetical protein